MERYREICWGEILIKLLNTLKNALLPVLSHSFRPDYNEMVGECWLQSARVARKAGHHQTAYNALLNAGESRLAELYVERAKWLWSKVMAKGMSSYVFSVVD